MSGGSSILEESFESTRKLTAILDNRNPSKPIILGMNDMLETLNARGNWQISMSRLMLSLDKANVDEESKVMQAIIFHLGRSFAHVLQDVMMRQATPSLPSVSPPAMPKSVSPQEIPVKPDNVAHIKIEEDELASPNTVVYEEQSVVKEEPVDDYELDDYNGDAFEMDYEDPPVESPSTHEAAPKKRMVKEKEKGNRGRGRPRKFFLPGAPGVNSSPATYFRASRNLYPSSASPSMQVDGPAPPSTAASSSAHAHDTRFRARKTSGRLPLNKRWNESPLAKKQRMIEENEDDEEEEEAEAPQASSPPSPQKPAYVLPPSLKKCPWCPHLFCTGGSKKAIHKHMRGCHNDLPGSFFRCSKCRRQFRTYNVPIHAEKCGGEMFFEYDAAPTRVPSRRTSCLDQEHCPFCPTILTSNRGNGISIETLARHLRLFHRDLPGTFFRCSECPEMRKRYTRCIRKHISVSSCGGRPEYIHIKGNELPRDEELADDVEFSDDEHENEAIDGKPEPEFVEISSDQEMPDEEIDVES